MFDMRTRFSYTFYGTKNKLYASYEIQEDSNGDRKVKKQHKHKILPKYLSIPK